MNQNPSWTSLADMCFCRCDRLFHARGAALLNGQLNVTGSKAQAFVIQFQLLLDNNLPTSDIIHSYCTAPTFSVWQWKLEPIPAVGGKDGWHHTAANKDKHLSIRSEPLTCSWTEGRNWSSWRKFTGKKKERPNFIQWSTRCTTWTLTTLPPRCI